MVARAVTRAWLASRSGASPPGRGPHPTGERTPLPTKGERADGTGVSAGRVDLGAEGDPRIRIAERSDIVPRRPGAPAAPAPSVDGEADDDGLWSSHLFWKGVVVGAVIVLLAKTVIGVRAPYGVDWFGF